MAKSFRKRKRRNNISYRKNLHKMTGGNFEYPCISNEDLLKVQGGEIVSVDDPKNSDNIGTSEYVYYTYTNNNGKIQVTETTIGSYRGGGGRHRAQEIKITTDYDIERCHPKSKKEKKAKEEAEKTAIAMEKLDKFVNANITIDNYNLAFSALTVKTNIDTLKKSLADDLIALCEHIKNTNVNVIAINIQFWDTDKEKPIKLLTNPADITKIQTLQETVKTIGTKIYTDFLGKYDVYKDNLDKNSPKIEHRLKIAMDGAFLIFFLDPKGTDKRTFSPTGHGGRNGFLRFKNLNTEFICGIIMDRRGVTFNAFGGSPDFGEEPHITVIREMIEEVFERLYRDPDKVVKTSDDYINGFKLLMSILKLNKSQLEAILENLDKLTENNDLRNIFTKVSLKGSIKWDGGFFPEHTLPTKHKVPSATTYWLTEPIQTTFNPVNVLNILNTCYSMTEAEGIFILEKTNNYNIFFTKLNDLLIPAESEKSITDREAYIIAKKKIKNKKADENDENIVKDFETARNKEIKDDKGIAFICKLSQIMTETQIDFLNISLQNKKITTPFNFKHEYDHIEGLLTIKLINLDFVQDIVFIKVTLDENFKILSKKEGDDFYINPDSVEMFFVLKKIFDDAQSKPGFSQDSNTGGRKYSKKRRKSRKHNKRRKSRKTKRRKSRN